MKKKLGVDSDIEKGATGDFEVTAGGSTLFSRRSSGRFPEPGEVEDMVKQLLEESG